MKRIGHLSRIIVQRGLHGFLGSTLLVRQNETATDRKEDALEKQMPILVERGKAHSVGMRNNIGHGIHLVTMKNQVLGLIERDGVATVQFQFFGGADHGEPGFYFRRIDAFRGLAGKSKQDGAVRAMAMAGKRKRAVKIDLDGCGLKS